MVGRPSERWGEEIVAIVALGPDATATADVLREHSCTVLARFKSPKDVLFVEQVRRLGNGKADYRWARDVAVGKVRV